MGRYLQLMKIKGAKKQPKVLALLNFVRRTVEAAEPVRRRRYFH